MRKIETIFIAVIAAVILGTLVAVAVTGQPGGYCECCQCKGGCCR